MCPIYFLAFVGSFVLIFYLYDVLKGPSIALSGLIKEFFGLGNANFLSSKYGNWAAITGSSDGIGKALARELARQGLNVVLISRSLQKLENVARDIASDFNVKTKIIVADFSKCEESCRLVEKELNEIPVRILINNVGQSTPKPGPIAKFTDEEIWSVIHTNIGPVTQLSRYFIQRLRDEGQRGLIVNVSSGTENVIVPNGAVYAASKAYNRSLTLALLEEARTHNIDVQLLSPDFVVTKINSYSKYLMRDGLFEPDPDTYARSACKRLGRLDHTTGYIWHDLEVAAIKMIPWRVFYFFTCLISRKLHF